jgi:hypothetical protein
VSLCSTEAVASSDISYNEVVKDDLAGLLDDKLGLYGVVLTWSSGQIPHCDHAMINTGLQFFFRICNNYFRAKETTIQSLVTLNSYQILLHLPLAIYKTGGTSVYAAKIHGPFVGWEVYTHFLKKIRYNYYGMLNWKIEYLDSAWFQINGGLLVCFIEC